MYELVKVWLRAVGPRNAPFDTGFELGFMPAGEATKKSSQFSPATVTILGENGSGKTLLAELICMVIEPASSSRRAASGRAVSPDLVSAGEVGVVILEWHNGESGSCLITGLAVKVSATSPRIDSAHFSFRTAQEPALSSLARSKSFTELRGQLAQLDSVDEVMWTHSSSEWAEHLSTVGLSQRCIVLLNNDHRRTRPALFDTPESTRRELFDEIVPKLIDSDKLAELVKLAMTKGIADLDFAEHFVPTLQAIIASALQRLSELASISLQSADGQEWASVVHIALSQPDADEIGERAAALLSEINASSRKLEINKLFRFVASILEAATDIMIYPAGDVNGRVSEKNFVGLSGGERDYISLLLKLFITFLEARRDGSEQDIRIVILDEIGTFDYEMTRRIRHAIPRHAQVVQLTARASPDTTGLASILTVHQKPAPEADRHVTVVTSALTLGALWSRNVIEDADPAVPTRTVPIAEVFEVLENPRRLQSGDLIIPGVLRVGDNSPISIVTEKGPPRWRENSELVLRPKRPQRKGEGFFYASYLGSDAFLGQSALVGELIFVRPADLERGQIPKADSETLRAINELTTASTSFDSWRRDADDAVSSFFEWRDLAEARAELIEAGRLTRQRREAARLLDEQGTRFRAALPYPIAYRWRDVEAAPMNESGYRRIFDCAEVAVSYCGAVGLAIAKASGVTVTRLSSIAGKLRQGQRPTFGDWVSVVSELTRIAQSGQQPADSVLQHFRSFAGGPNSAMFELKNLRNDMSHGRGPAMHEMSSSFATSKAKLQMLLGAAEWLADYPLRFIESERWDSFGGISKLEFRELMGDHSVVRLKEDEASGHLEAGSIYLADQFGRYNLMRPFFHGGYCSDCGRFSVYIIDGWNSSILVAEYKAMDHSHVLQLGNVYPALNAVGLVQ